MERSRGLQFIIPYYIIFGMIRKRQSSKASRGARLRSLQAISSPVRQEILSELSEGGATVKELSVRLGRTRQALHFHIGVLERAGLIETVDSRGTGRTQEAVFRVRPAKLDLRARRALSPRERESATRAARALLRLTQREIAHSMRHEDFAASAVPVALAIRAKARLSDAKLRRLHTLVQAVCNLFRQAKGKHPHSRPLALTLVLTPTRTPTPTLTTRPARERHSKAKRNSRKVVP